MLHYQLTEDQYFKLESVGNQLRMVSSLLGGHDAQRLMDAEGLSDFMIVQSEALELISADLEARGVQQPTPVNEPSSLPVFSGEDLRDLIAMASGADLPETRMIEVAAALLLTQPDGADSEVFQAMVKGMKRRGMRLAAEQREGEVQTILAPIKYHAPTRPKPATRKREKLVAA